MQSFSNPLGFRFHFQFEVEVDPDNAALLMATPLNSTLTLTHPSKLFNEISFEFFTHKPLTLHEDQYQCFVDYTQPFLTLYQSNGLPHGLTNIDVVSI